MATVAAKRPSVGPTSTSDSTYPPVSENVHAQNSSKGTASPAAATVATIATTNARPRARRAATGSATVRPPASQAAASPGTTPAIHDWRLSTATPSATPATALAGTVPRRAHTTATAPGNRARWA